MEKHGILKKMNLNLLKKGGKIFEGSHDFSTFRALLGAKSPIKWTLLP